MTKSNIVLLPIFILLILSVGIAGAQTSDQFVVNSADWVDVYSTIMYANIEGAPYYFVINEAHGLVLPQYMDKSLDIHLIESSTVPYMSGYKATLEKACLLYTSDAADEEDSVDL